MKKLLLLMVSFVLTLTAALAQATATFDFTNPTALTPSITPSETISTGVPVSDQTFTANGISLVATKGSNDAVVFTTTKSTNELRVYKTATLTIASTEGKNISSIVFAGGKISAMSTTVGTFASGSWTGSATSVEFSVTGTLNITSVAVTVEGGSTDGGNTGGGDTDQKTTLFSETFGSSLGDFTTENKTLAEGLSYVWTYASGYGAKASAFANKTSYASESWLISPVIDCTKASALSLSFEHCINKGVVSEMQNEQKLYVREAEGEWKELPITTYPTGSNWTFVSTTEDVSAYDGKKVQFAFAYTSTSESCATWEIKNFKLEGKGEANIEEPDATSYTTLKAMQDAATTTQTAATYTSTNLLVLGVGKRGSNYTTYVTDGTAYAILYGPNEPIAKKGDIISGTLSGKLCFYNLSLELVAVDFSQATVASSGNAVTPKDIIISDLGTGTAGAYQSQYVRLSNVNFDAEALSNSNINIVDDVDNTIVLRDNYGVLSDFVFDTAKPYNVNAYVAYYNSKAQLYVCSADDIEIITNLKDAETAWESETVVVTPNETAKANTLNTLSDGAKTFTSSNENVATVDAEGNVTRVGYGHTVITVETAETATYLASKASYDLYYIEGEGTFDTPYAASDVEYYNGRVSEKVWVKGTIIGYISDTKKGTYSPIDDNVVSTNLALGTEDAYIPVQLPKGDVRTALNLVDNPSLQGTTVWLYGELATYCGKPGLKNVSNFSLDGVTAISTATLAPAEGKTVIYSIDGRRLQQPVKGINIINGKKVVVK